MPVWSCVCLLWKNTYSFTSSAHCLIVLFVILILIFCVNSLCVLDINPLSDVSCANIISSSGSCLFVLSMVPFAVQKLLNLIRPQLFIFAFISFAGGDRNIATSHVKECFAFVVFQEFYSFRSFI